jgi:hypothetical protein
MTMDSDSLPDQPSPSPEANADAGRPHRYHAADMELRMLVEAAPRYYEVPERSQARTSICQEVMTNLRALGRADWTMRAVRVWFNNNQHSLSVKPSPVLGPEIALLASDRPARRSDIDDVIAAFNRLVDRLEWERPPPAPSPEFMNTQTASYIVKANLPLTHPRHPAFRQMVAGIQPRAPLPSVGLIRQQILDLAEAFRQDVTHANEGFQFVHLMADTAKVRGKHFLGVCLATLNSYLPYYVIEIPDQTGEAISDYLGKLIRDLNRRGLTTCGVVTDNAKAEIKTVNLLKEEHSVFRVPCLSHTANLVIKDFFTQLYPKHNAITELNALVNVLPHGKGDDFHGCPTLTVTRWFCLWDLFTYVVSHYELIEEFLQSDPSVTNRDEILAIFKRYDFRGILPFLTLICSFIKWTEGEDSTLSAAWGLILHVHRTLVVWKSQLMSYANLFLDCFAERFTKTADVSGMLMAYLMSSDGLTWYRSLNRETVGECILTQELVNDLSASVRDWFVKLTGLDAHIFEQTWMWYLANGSFEGEGRISFWSTMRTTKVRFPGRTDKVLCWALGTLGLLLTIMPVSEAGVERIFSHLRDLLLAHRVQMEAELVDARIILKLNNYPDRITCAARLRELDRVPSPDQIIIAPLPVPAVQRNIPRFAAHPGSGLPQVDLDRSQETP